MSNATTSRKPRQQNWTVRLSCPASADNPFSIITVTQGHDVDDYIVQPIPSDWVTALEVKKIFDADEKAYHVNLDRQGQACDCKGFLRWNHCKHVSALTVLP
jgi:hypothetical protein